MAVAQNSVQETAAWGRAALSGWVSLLPKMQFRDASLIVVVFGLVSVATALELLAQADLLH